MFVRRIFSILTLAALLVPVCSGLAFGGEVDVPATGVRVGVLSMKEMRDARVVQQEHDFSCGSAAVATLLTYSYETPVTEQEAFNSMYRVGDQAHIQKFGFSLLDMQKYLGEMGIQSAGYKVSLGKLLSMHMPAIALISPHGYNHFVTVRGVDAADHSVIVADPRLGLRRVKAEEFQSMWNGVIFVMQNYKDIGWKHFNDPRDLILIGRISVDGLAYGREGISDALMNIPLFNNF